jgi:hypothetical protein
MDEHPRYRAFLVRLWSVAEVDGLSWRASIQDVHSGDTVSFADPAAMIAFFRSEIRCLPDRQPFSLIERGKDDVAQT